MIINLPIVYQWIAEGCLIIPFGYTYTGGAASATYAFGDHEGDRLDAFTMMTRGRLPRC